ncbi:MAG: TetR/AcrR family transcriptional regulator [Lagierella massiliensis]|nr:TetR/AcrR family transcriptional regulator [Lagierella massiliensis]
MVRQTYLNLDKSKREMIKENVLKMFIENKYEDVTIRELSQKCDISIGSFYKYFESKDDMYLYYMCEIEQKILDEEYKHNRSLFTSKPYSDLKNILTPLEIGFNRTWLKVPNYILSKFYFEGYAENLNSRVLKELDKLYDEGKIFQYFEKDMVKFVYITYMYNFILYIKKKEITSDVEFIRLKKLYSEKIVFKGIFKADFYEKMFGK